MTEKVRNVFCPHYKSCLDKAVKQNSPGFDCSGCEHKNDKVDLGEIDIERSQLLLSAIFKPSLYSEYRKTEAARAQAERSKPGRPNGD